MIFLHDPIKQAQLDDAIERGFINKTVAEDGVVVYELTLKGMAQWQFEKFFNPQPRRPSYE